MMKKQRKKLSNQIEVKLFVKKMLFFVNYEYLNFGIESTKGKIFVRSKI